MPQLTPEEVLLRDKWARVLEMAQKGRLDALRGFWEREGAALGGVDARVPEWVAVGSSSGRTLLQVAARAGQAEVVKWLLEEQRADPTIDVPVSSIPEDDEKDEKQDEDEEDEEGLLVRPPPGPGSRRTAYDLARTREIRNVFRRSAGAHPDWWDWLGMERGARVPSVLSAEMEGGREERRKERRKGLKERVREREAREKEKEKEREREREMASPVVAEKVRVKQEESLNGPRRLGGSAGSMESVAGLTPEMRLKIERERRARAIEARLKNLK